MRIVVERADVRCGHDGTVAIRPSQRWVRMQGSPVLVDDDPPGSCISGCPNAGVNIKPCGSTLAVKAGYSTFIRIGGQRACLDTLEGLTDGTPPGAVKYTVRDPGQHLVGSTS
jgi:hypothetical protein